MTYSFFRVISPSLVLAALLEYMGCSSSRGTNTGNGTTGYCPALSCEEPVIVTGSDGTTYRGIIGPDLTISTDSYAQSLPNPPVAELGFTGGEVDVSDAGCREEAGSGLQVQIFISTADSSIDASGALHVHSAARNDIYAAGPGDIYQPPTPGWAVDLTVTADGQLTATLSVVSSSSLDAGGAMQELKFSGPIQPLCIGADGKLGPASIPVSGGSTFTFPCWHPKGCFDWSH